MAHWLMRDTGDPCVQVKALIMLVAHQQCCNPLGRSTFERPSPGRRWWCTRHPSAPPHRKRRVGLAGILHRRYWSTGTGHGPPTRRNRCGGALVKPACLTEEMPPGLGFQEHRGPICLG